MLYNSYLKTKNTKKAINIRNLILTINKANLESKLSKSQRSIDSIKRKNTKDSIRYSMYLKMKRDTLIIKEKIDKVYFPVTNNLDTLLSSIQDTILKQQIKIHLLNKENKFNKELLIKNKENLIKQKTINKYSIYIGILLIVLLVFLFVLYLQILFKNKYLKFNIGLKSKFFSIISHDIKSPLRNIKTSIDILKKKNNNDISYINISQQISNLYEFIEKINLWAKTQYIQSKIQYEKIMFHSIVNDNYKLLLNSFIEKNIELNHSEEDMEINADKNMLNTILRNLLNNAIKFSYENSVIKVECYKDKHYTYISVIDNGIGIKKEDKKKLFKIEENFTTKGTKNESGTGVGLIICKEFIKLHNGNIYITSENKRTEFKFSIKNVKTKKATKK